MSDDARPQEPRPTPTVKVNLCKPKRSLPLNALVTIEMSMHPTRARAPRPDPSWVTQEPSPPPPRQTGMAKKAYTGSMQVRVGRTTRYSLECFSKTAASTKVDIVVAVELLEVTRSPYRPTAAGHTHRLPSEPLIVSWLSQDVVRLRKSGRT